MVKFVNLAEIDANLGAARANDQRMQLNQLLMDRQQRQFAREDNALAQENALKQAYKNSVNADGSFDNTLLLKNIGQVAPQKAYALSQDIKKQGREDETYNLQKQKAELGILADKAQQARDLLARATPETYPSIIQSLMQDPMTAKGVEGAPSTYNAEWVASNIQDADSAIQNARMQAQQEFTADQNAQNRAITVRGQNITASNAAQSRALTRRGQDLQASLALAKQNTATGQPLSKGQEALDKEFAKTYADYKAKGGFADTQKQIQQLQSASEALSSGRNLTGAVMGRLPDAIKEVVNSEAVDVRERVEEVVQRNLREVLGAQFTEKEGARLIARAFNENLDESVNKRRVDALIKQMTVAAKTKEDAANYFEQHGTLQGWSGKMPSMADFEAAISNSSSAGSSGGWSIKKVK